jgi:cellulose synthase/poly-beta-1,6-N-acetylglucosamine synthase-like glycosyltransferase
MSEISSKIQVSVCIPAHNEAATIGSLLAGLLRQEQNKYSLKEILVYSDASTDSTVKVCASLNNEKIHCIEGKKRIGKLQGLGTLFEASVGDVIVILDADIAFFDDNTLDNLISPFLLDPSLGLVGGNPLPTPAHTFIEQAMQTSISAYRNIALHLRGGANPYNCHGSILALSRRFAEIVELPKKVYSDDTYLYFSCLYHHFKFAYIPEAKVWYAVPNNLKDAVAQYTRFLSMDEHSLQKFNQLLEGEYAVPFLLKFRYLFKEFMSHPLATITMYGIKLYCKYFPQPGQDTHDIWDSVKSTKNDLSNV